MNQFKDWGFSAQSWRGEKGEYWVLGQTVLSVGFVLLPIYPTIALDSVSPLWQYAGWGLTGLFSLIAALLLLFGSLELGSNLTPLPHPKHDGELVTGGVYAIVRHPIYSGVIFLTIAYSCWQLSFVHAIGAILFLLFFDLKARKEESWLSNKFSGYDQYRSQVKKLIPWIY
jgi:protein-S-isoprenylcysteine O-methyltransferase Ste14